MSGGSLKLRLFAAGAASILAALAVAGFGLLLLFERHVERRMALELESHLRQLVSGVDRDAAGSLQLAPPPAEPRFAEPLSGLYWQIATEPGRPALRSRSLWDIVLEPPPDALADGEVHRHSIAGPRGSRLLAVERTVRLPERLGGAHIRALVAIDRSEIHAAGRDFAADLAPSLALLALVLMAAAWVQVTVGLRPLDALRRQLRDVRAGSRERLGAAFPDEIAPLAAEVDHLLEAQESALERARSRAADLAHALKTPLSVLTSVAEQLSARGDAQAGEEVAAMTDSMRRQIERELARARAGAWASRGAACQIRPIVDRVASVLRRTPRGHELDWEIAVPDDASARVDAQDLTEILGNLAENAAKWAAAKVRIAAERSGETTALSVEDDGPGAPEGKAADMLARGARLDESQPGSGLGLAIVNDLVEAYGGSLGLRKSPLGGLLAEVRFRDDGGRPADRPPERRPDRLAGG